MLFRSFWGILESGSPRALDYQGQLAALDLAYQNVCDRIDKFLIDEADLANSVRLSRGFSGRWKRVGLGVPIPLSQSSDKGSEIDRRSAIKLLGLQLLKVTRDSEFRDKSAQLEAEKVKLEAERAWLQAEIKLKEAHILANAEAQYDAGRSGCSLELEGETMSFRDRVLGP